MNYWNKYTILQIRTTYTFNSTSFEKLKNDPCFRTFPMFWNVASAREWDFTAQMVWWCCAAARLRTLEGTLAEIYDMMPYLTDLPFWWTAKAKRPLHLIIPSSTKIASPNCTLSASVQQPNCKPARFLQLVFCSFLQFGVVLEMELGQNLMKTMPGHNRWGKRCG